MKYAVVSRQEAENILTLVSAKFNCPVCISIAGAWEEPAKLPKGYFADILRLHFDDITYLPTDWQEEGLRMFGENDAKQIVDFVNAWKDRTDFLVIHCAAGKSRSAGVAVAIFQAIGEEDCLRSLLADRTKYPNPVVVDTLTRALQKLQK